MPANNLELRAYRYISTILLSVLVGICGVIANNIYATTQDLPALKEQIRTLNENFAAMKNLPLEVRTNSLKNDEQDRRLAWLELRRR